MTFINYKSVPIADRVIKSENFADVINGSSQRKCRLGNLVFPHRWFAAAVRFSEASYSCDTRKKGLRRRRTSAQPISPSIYLPAKVLMGRSSFVGGDTIVSGGK